MPKKPNWSAIVICFQLPFVAFLFAAGLSCRGDNATVRTSGSTPALKQSTDLLLAGTVLKAPDRLVFDGYKLKWMSPNTAEEYMAFSGSAGEDAKESTPDVGPTPQGLFAVDPSDIEEFEEAPDWGRYRVRLQPYASTVERMKDCFGVVRTGMYIHGGKEKGTRGCIEINDDREEQAFFKRLKAYGKKIELEIIYIKARKKAYEEPRCPYP